MPKTIHKHPTHWDIEQILTNSPATKFSITFNSVTSPVVAGAPFDVTVTALDAEDNTATNYTGGHTLTFTWNSAADAPDGTVPLKLGVLSRTFTSGQFISSGNAFALFNDATTAATLTVTDGSISGTTVQTLAVDHAVPAEYRLEGTTAQVAGTGFNMSVRAYDQYENVANTYAGSDNLTFTWSGATATNSANGGGHNRLPESTTPATTYSFTAGLATSSGNAFKVFKEGETPRVDITTSSNGIAVTGDFG